MAEILALILLLSPIGLGIWIYLEKKKNSRLEDECEKYLKVARGWKKKHDSIRAKYEPIVDLDEEVDLLRNKLGSLESEYDQKLMDLERSLKVESNKIYANLDKLRSEYQEKRTVYDHISHEVHELQEAYSFMEIGIYEPHFDYQDSEAFKRQIQKVQDEKKSMVKSGNAIRVSREFTVQGSVKEGQKMVKRQIDLTLRAFNGEANTAITNTRWNNVLTMEKRIEKAAAAINKANQSMDLTIEPRYIALKLKELRLTHEYREKQKQEKEERAELARAEREEAKLLQEAERAEREERKYQALLDKAMEEARRGDQSDKLKERIALLESDLEAARAEKERSKAMAEMTKCGYVYVISNIGSFGDDIVKIGLTRRLDPDDRIRELSGASVPFSFDKHAMIYSTDAPALEAALHREFNDSRVNIANNRKEFFRCGVHQVKEAIERLAPDAQFFADPEAREYRETLQIRAAKLGKSKADPILESAFPSAI